MNHKINIKARVNRHLRIARQNVSFGKKYYSSKFFSYRSLFSFFIIIFILPIYPGLSSFFYKNKVDFYRGDIDESSILSSYYLGDDRKSSSFQDFSNQNNSFLSVDTILDNKRDLEGINEIVTYSVQTGDSLSSIANDFGVSLESILWANNFSRNHIIRPGEEIKFPSVSGIIYNIKKGDTLEKIAQKYDIKLSEIEKTNSIQKTDILLAGNDIILPGAKKIFPKVVYEKPSKKNYYKKSPTKNISYKKVNNTPPVKGAYKLVRRKPLSGFARYNCTRYVAQYKNVKWRGNANQWIRNASKAGYATGNAAKPGAIIQFSGRGYNPRYGHVGIVIKVESSYILVSDMNYRKLGEATTRKIPINDRSIDGYIYVN